MAPPSPRLLIAMLLLSLFAVSAFANDCEICDAKGKNCKESGEATLSGIPNFIQVSPS